MTINYSLHKNHLTNGAGHYRAMVETTETVDLESVIDLMLFRGSSIHKADMLAVLEDYNDTIIRLVLEGKKVVTPGANYSVSIKGNFDNEGDSFDPSRHQVVAALTPGVRLRRAVESRAQVAKQETTVPHPNPRQYANLNNGDGNDRLTAGGLARVGGYRLKFDQADPGEGIFLLPLDPDGLPDAGRPAVHIEMVGRNTARELLFVVPNGLAGGDYTLEVRAHLSQSELRAGRLPEVLTAA